MFPILTMATAKSLLNCADADEYVADSSDAGGVEDEAEEGGDSDDGGGDGGRPVRGGRRGAAEPDEERKSQNVDALVRYSPARPSRPMCACPCCALVVYLRILWLWINRG